jgi:tetratricopeptide (TPR) repeat protein
MPLTFTRNAVLSSVLAAMILSIMLTFSSAWAQSVEESYSRAVQQLNREGFAGIDGALAVFEGLIQRDPDFVRGYVSAADAYLLKYEFTERKDRQWLARALSYLDTAAGKERNNPAIYFKRAVIRFNLEQPDRAVEDLRKSMDLAPQYLDARLLYLQHLLSVKNQVEARKFVDDSIANYPGDPAPLRYLADVVFAGGDNEKAVELYREVVRLVPNAPNTYLALGKAHLNLKQYPEAIASFQKALEGSPDLLEARFSMAVAYSETGKLKEAVMQLEDYLRKVPGDASALNNLALLYEQTGDVTQAQRRDTGSNLQGKGGTASADAVFTNF